MKKGILIVVLFCVFTSCKREYDQNKFGPEVIIVPENFEVTGFTINPSNSIDLGNEDGYFNCSMPQRAEFKITISGLLSGALKIVSGTGEFIDLSNSSWTGDSDNLNIFRTGEKCLVELSFRGATKKYYDTITVLAANIYPNTLLINDFEGIVFDKNAGNAVGYGTYYDTLDLPQTNIRTDDSLIACQGTQSVEFKGEDLNNSFYVGGLYLAPPVTPYTFDTYSPNSLYLNAYIYSYGDNTTSLIFVYGEDENDDNVVDENWTKEVLVEGQGWSLISIPFKSFTDENVTIGNGIPDLDKIIGFNVNVKPRLAGGKVHANVDYITVSYGKPFEP
jgi:hypothetical protein